VLRRVSYLMSAVAMLGVVAGCYQENRRISPVEPIGESESTTQPTSAPSEQKSVATDRPSEDGPISPTSAPVITKKIRCVIETNLGHMEAELWPDVAPLTVANFVRLAEGGYYENLPCHRMLPGFMVQFGKAIDPARAAGVKPIKGEFSPTFKHEEGTLSMARQPSDPDSATTQFFICFKPKNADEKRYLASLDGKYAIFGKVTKGMDILGEIESVPTTTQPMGVGRSEPSKPSQPILLRAVRVLK